MNGWIPKLKNQEFALQNREFWVGVFGQKNRIDRSPKSFSGVFPGSKRMHIPLPGVSSPGPWGSTRPGDAGRGDASLPPGENLSRSYQPSILGGGSASDVRARDPAQFRISGAGACSAGGRHRAWRGPLLSKEACASTERGCRRVAPMCGENAARPAAAPLISSAHSPEVCQIESGGKLRDETGGFNFGITA